MYKPLHWCELKRKEEEDRGLLKLFKRFSSLRAHFMDIFEDRLVHCIDKFRIRIEPSGSILQFAEDRDA